jgi:hypothetical protein
MSAWHGPQSIYNLGHRAVKDLFTVPVQIQEKVDGSFFAFGLFEDPQLMEFDVDGSRMELKVRSKGAVMIPDAPEALFKLAVQAVKNRERLLHPGWQYRGETLAKPKHNTLSYDRVPKDNIILFDVLTDEETYLPYEELCAEGERLGLEVVPQLFSGVVADANQLRQYLDRTSVLGGQKIEGVVVKPLTPLYGPDKKMLFGKFVSEAFKEVHRLSWGESNPTQKDVIQRMIEAYAHPVRFHKAVTHLREAGQLEDSPRDIGKLIREIPDDIRKECEEDIKNALFKQAWPHISRGITKQVPDWYKDQLLRLQFEKESDSDGGVVTEG